MDIPDAPTGADHRVPMRPPPRPNCSHKILTQGRKSLYPPPPPAANPPRSHRLMDIPDAPPAAKAFSHHHLDIPDAPTGDGPRPRVRGAATSWADIVSAKPAVAPSSQGLLPPPPPPPHHGQPGRAAGRHGLPHGQLRQAAGRQPGGQAPHGRPGQAAVRQGHPGKVSPVTSLAGKASSSHGYPNWVMLDPHTRLNHHTNQHFHAVADTTMGGCIDVSFRTVAPPGASRLYVHWTPHTTKGESSSAAPGSSDQFSGRVVAAHGNSILLQLTFEDAQSDFFIYTLPSSTGLPSLILLPSCDHQFTLGTHSYGGLDHMSTIEEIGLLCNAEREKFVVADLLIVPSEPCKDDAPRVVAELCVLQGSHSMDGWTTVPWRAIRPQIRYDKKEQGKGLMWWETDAVLPFRDSLCYVDYFRGIFFVNVLSKNPVLQYVQLPVTIPNGDPVDPQTGLRGCPQLYRSLCVTNDGCILKFVQVVTTTVFVSGSSAPASSSFAINVWKLRQEDDSLTWEKEYVMEDTELWALVGSRDLPRVAPSFPFLSMEKPHVVYFVLTNRRSNEAGASWLIVVDMLNKTMQSLSRYNKVYPNSNGSDDDMASANLTSNRAFIPCDFSKYLHLRA